MRRTGHIAATLACCAALGAVAPRSEAAPRVLRVCADPNNLPFSNRQGEGFENKLAELVARDLDATVQYTWWAQRRGYVRSTLNAGDCDLVPGTASGVEQMATTRPYYRSTYVFVTREKDQLDITSFDDARLRALTIGVQMIGNDATNTPPAHALARRGIVDNVRGFMLYGDYNRPNPPAGVVDAVASGAIDVGLIWGPLAAYFAARESQPLRLQPVQPGPDAALLPMTFDISMGVRRHDVSLLHEVDAILLREKPAIAAILAAYRVPVIDRPPT